MSGFPCLLELSIRMEGELEKIYIQWINSMSKVPYIYIYIYLELPGLVDFIYIIVKGTLCSKSVFADYREREKELNKNI